ncbi:hypothetical protein HU200_011153 [Digitaria exilis]|uniref:Uncharacterized protein n=1 Tax=Digitaria exilis TaxID=1010633 RepID=A0A835FGL2_9POAL|nr:hypothetical protein HU200_011153 [Digitaria exilis]
MKSTKRSISQTVKYWRAVRARFEDPAVGDRIHRQLLRLPRPTGQGLHRACQLLHGAGEQGDARPKNVAADWKKYTSLTPEGRNKGGYQGAAAEQVQEVHGMDVSKQALWETRVR